MPPGDSVIARLDCNIHYVRCVPDLYKVACTRSHNNDDFALHAVITADYVFVNVITVLRFKEKCHRSSCIFDVNHYFSAS